MNFFGICGCPDAYLMAFAAAEEAGSLPRWNKNPVTWRVDKTVPPFALDQYIDICKRAFAAISAVCGLDFQFVEKGTTADITKYCGDIDGIGGTLAWSELAPGDDRPLQQKFDKEGPAGSWPALEMLLTQEHEDIHALGIGHGPAGSLMAPVLNTSVSGPQAWDINELVKRYGPRKGTPPPPPPVNKVVIEILNPQPGQIRIPGFRITPA